MEKSVMEKYLKAGGICAEIRQEIQKKLSPGAKILEIAEKIKKPFIVWFK